MNAKTEAHAAESEDLVVLGVASVETHGGVFDTGEPMGLNIGAGISEE